MNLCAHAHSFSNKIRAQSVFQRRIHNYHVLHMKSNDGRWSQSKLRRFAPQERAKLEDLVVPQLVPIGTSNPNLQFDGVSSHLTRQFISTILDQFARKPHLRELAEEEQKITNGIFEKAFQSFRLHCCSSEAHIMSMEPELKIVFSDIQNQEQSVDMLYPYFVKHAHKVFPHLQCIDELQEISDLTKPHNWYPEARTIHRKIVFHAGPTNSGKTYEALQVLKNANSGMYCGPLRLLAYEVYERMNKEGVLCDLVTGERRLFANNANNPASHCAYTVEMVSPTDRRNVCVIDEIQMLRDITRGAAWTKALLGAAVDELHLCGEEAAIPIVERLLDPIGEHVDICRYKRKGDLVVINTHGLDNLANVEDGDCIIHFNKASIFQVAKKLKEEHGINSAIIFGDLPPETKKEQINRFNDPNDPIKVLLATDAIGMGMNLNIKRIIFSTLMMPYGNFYPAYFVKQIAGRAGRFHSRYCTGEVMTMRNDEAKLLDRLMKEPIKDIEKAGIAPYYEMIEMFSLHLPHCSLIQLIDIFVSIAKITDDFFVSMSPQIREIANLIDHIPLSLKDRWIFCTCPVSAGNHPFLNTAYVKIVRRYSQGNSITVDWVRAVVEPIMKPANNLANLQTLVEVYDFLYAYLWLSYKLEDYFIHRDAVRELQSQCTKLINKSIKIMVGFDALEIEPKRTIKTGSTQSATDSKNVAKIKEFNIGIDKPKEAQAKRDQRVLFKEKIEKSKKKASVRSRDINPAFKMLTEKIGTKRPPSANTGPNIAFKSLADEMTKKSSSESNEKENDEGS